MANILYYEDIQLVDGVKGFFGTGEDMEIYHNGSSSVINNNTGDFIIKTSVDNGDIYFQADNGSGGEETYFRLDGGDENVQFSHDILLYDNVNLKIGTDGDFQAYHNGSTTYLRNNTGTLEIRNQTSGASDVYFKTTTSSPSLDTFIILDGSAEQTQFTKDTEHQDGVYARFGNSSDLSIVHTGSTGYIQNYTGDLQIQSNGTDADILLRSDDGSGGLATYMYLDGGNTRVQFNKDARFVDDKKLMLGTSDDLQIYHDVSHSYIEDTGTGQLRLKSNSEIQFLSDTNDFHAKMVKDGAVELYYDNTKKFETTNTGVDVTGGLTTSASSSIAGINMTADIAMGDYDITGIDELKFTSGSKFGDQGSSNYIRLTYNAAGGGGMHVVDSDGSSQGYIYGDGNTTSSFGLLDGGANWAVRCVEGEGVNLRYNNSKKLETSNTGVTVTGDITVSGGDIYLDGTGRIQGIDTVSASTDAASKAYVDNLTTGVLTYQGTWNASTNSPTLSSGSGTPGYYYIVSVAGSTNLDGITDWAVGDWAVFSDQATDAWQKIDNTAVGNVSGSGTIERLAKWSGSGTLANSIITDDGSSVSVAGTLTVTGADAITIPDYILHSGDDSKFGFPSNDNFKVRLAGSDVFTMSTSNATFAGDITVGDDVFIADSGIINLGSGNDLILFHDGADGVIRNTTGHTYFDNLALNQDIYIRGNDGGSTITALTLDMSSGGTATFNNELYIPNYIYHVGDANTYFGFAGADNIKLVNGGNTALHAHDNGNLYLYGGGGTTLTLDTSQNATFAGRVDVAGGDVNIQAGALSITSDGSNKATFTETGAGLLTIATQDDLVLDAASDIILDAAGDDIRLRVNGTEFGKFNNASSNLNIYSSIQDKDIVFWGNDAGSSITALTLDMSAAGAATFNNNISSGGHVYVTDGNKFIAGSGEDLQIYHDGSNSYIDETGTGDLIIKGGNDILFQDAVGNTLANMNQANSVELYYGNSKKFETTSTGADIDGTLTLDTLAYGGSASTALSFGMNSFSFANASGTIISCNSSRTVSINENLIVSGISSDANVSLSDSDLVLSGDSNIELDTSVSSTQSSGTIIKIGSHMSALVAGNIYYAGNSMGNLYWYGADADSSSTENMLALSVGTDADVDGMLLNGIYHKASHGLTVGEPIYLSTTSMAMTNTAPSGANDYVRVLGYALDSNHIYFCPDNTWVKISS
jgi:hypothetical protein